MNRFDLLVVLEFAILVHHVPCATGSNSSDYTVHDVIGMRCCPADMCWPSQQAVADFNNGLDGRVILPHMTEYINQSHMYNTVEQRYPGIVVMVHSKEDIKNAILFARKYNLHVTIRSSGHDYVGRSTWDGSLNINLSEMKDKVINLNSSRNADGEIKVQTGLTWAEIYKTLDPYKRSIVGGSAHTVTPGGYTLGGGHSPISRSLGYAVDNVLEIQVVLADGSIATCTEMETVIEEPTGYIKRLSDGDLFWALRGGGGGTFGVVVYYVFKLHKMPSQMVKFEGVLPLKVDTFSLDLSGELLSVLGGLILTLPREWGGYYILNNAKITVPPKDTGLSYDLHLTGSLSIAMNKFASWDGTEYGAFGELIAFAKKYNITTYGFSNKTSFWDYEKDVYDPPIVRTYLAGTMLQPEKVNEDLISFIQTEFFETFKDAHFACTGIMLGGRTTEFPVQSTPLHPGYRSAVSCLTCGVALASGYESWFEQSKWDDVLIPAADDFSSGLRKFGSGMYYNEPTKNNPFWREDFWGDHYSRLLAIKRQYDPENFFTCHHCVGSEMKGKPTVPWPTSSSSRLTAYFIASLFLVALACIF